MSVFGAVNPDVHEQTQGWRSRLDPVTMVEIEEILAASSIKSWWPENQVEREAVA